MIARMLLVIRRIPSPVDFSPSDMGSGLKRGYVSDLGKKLVKPENIFRFMGQSYGATLWRRTNSKRLKFPFYFAE